MMTEMPDDAAAKFLAAMRPDLDLWSSGDDIDFQLKYQAVIPSIGPVAVLTEAFRRFEGTTLQAYLGALTFLWKDLPFSSWKEILYGISGSTQAMYQFVWFASPFLRVDLVAILQNDPHVDEGALAFVRMEFPRGTPPCRSWEREILENAGVDPIALWRRLASEGAPMQIDPYQLQ